jgi:hypothetical protein
MHVAKKHCVLSVCPFIHACQAGLDATAAVAAERRVPSGALLAGYKVDRQPRALLITHRVALNTQLLREQRGGSDGGGSAVRLSVGARQCACHASVVAHPQAALKSSLRQGPCSPGRHVCSNRCRAGAAASFPAPHAGLRRGSALQWMGTDLQGGTSLLRLHHTARCTSSDVLHPWIRRKLAGWCLLARGAIAADCRIPDAPIPPRALTHAALLQRRRHRLERDGRPSEARHCRAQHR